MERERRESRRSAVVKEQRRKQLIRKRLIIRCVIGIVAFILGTGTGWLLRGTTIRKAIDLSAIKAPEWIDQQFLTVNPYSRPGTPIGTIRGIVIHYTANPGSSARQNRDYFEGLKDSGETHASSHFIIGLDGEIVQCIPCNEISYASNDRNDDTISIECCIPDETGQFRTETYQSLVTLTSWLCRRYGLSADQVIRHYDVTGKLCPKYYVEHPEAWEQFKSELETS